MHKATIIMMMIAATAACGCKSTGFLAKREAEKCCPTDIRKTVPWCAGEDALFKCPCEPSTAFYGYKPTCWRTWPTNGSTWRDMHCGNQHHAAVITELTNQNPELIELPALKSLPAPATEAEAEQPEGKEEPVDSQPAISVPSVKIDLEPAPEAPEVPMLKQDLLKKQPSVPEETTEQPAPTVGVPEAIREDLPRPVLGPIPLPPVDEEYAE